MESFVWTCKCSKSVSLLILGGEKNDQDTQYSHTSISRQPAACKEKRILTHASEQTVWTTASPCCLRSNTALSIYCSTAICARLLLTIKWSSDFLYSDLFLFFFFDWFCCYFFVQICKVFVTNGLHSSLLPHTCTPLSAAEWLQAAVADLSSLDQQLRAKGSVTPL